jgi:glutamate-1-semialdehyde aminotransferase
MTNSKQSGPTNRINTAKGQELYKRACSIIPGGTQLFSKRPELFLPDQWPVYYKKAVGIEVWDLDDNHYLDFASVGIGTSVLGAADEEVNKAVIEAVQNGSMSTLNPPDEVELAELMVELHPWAEQVRFARTGGESMAVAARIARAATGRDKIAICGYHGWADWYLAANIGDEQKLNAHLLPGLAPNGVPQNLRGTTIPFKYNDLDEIRAVIESAGSDLAAVIMEPHGVVAAPSPGYLAEVKRLAHEAGAVLIFDEITSGWRMSTAGVHMTLGVTPDVAVFAKCISNGYPMAAIIGTRAVMEAAQVSFISSAYWTESVGPAAALATLKKHRRENVGDYLIAYGNALDKGWTAAAAEAGLPIKMFGMAPQRGFSFVHDDPNGLTTLFTQEMLARGFIAVPRVFATFAHNEEHLGLYMEAVAEVFAILATAIEQDDIRTQLNGPVKHSHFERLNN